jgi:hypothetical protein
MPFAPRRGRAALTAALAALSLSACAQVDAARHSAMNLVPFRAAPQTAPLAGPLAPARRPAAPLTADFSARDLMTGGTLRLDASYRNGRATVRQSDGCVWTRSGDWFTPSSAWENCDGGAWATGSAEVRAIGSLWPLREGAQGAFQRTARSAGGDSYDRRTDCRVTGAETVIRESGARTPAWVVACRDGKRTRTTWFAPGEGPVAFRKVHDRNGVEEAWVRL